MTERYTEDEWSGLANFLANMIEKYADRLDIDHLPEINARGKQVSNNTFRNFENLIEEKEAA